MRDGALCGSVIVRCSLAVPVLQTRCPPGMVWWVETSPALSASLALSGQLFSFHLCWGRLYCTGFPLASKQLVYFPLQNTVPIGSHVASPALPPPGAEGPWW